MNELIYLRAETGALRTASGHLVVPVVALVGDIVMRAVNSDAPEFIPVSTLSSNIAEWSRKPVCFGHPQKDGKQISANTPDVLAAQALGTIEQARVSGNRLLMDCHIDPVKAKQVGASRLLERLQAGQTSEISVGCFVVTDNTPGISPTGQPYARRWLSLKPDHLAVGIERGACSCDAHGCGTFQRAAAHKSADDYAPPDAYARDIARQREQNATPESRFEDRHRAERQREFAAEYAREAAREQPPRPRPTDAERARYTPPNPYPSLGKVQR